MIYTHVAVGLAAGALAATMTWQVQNWRYTGKVERIHAAHARALADANEDALKKTIAIQKRKDDAIAKSQELARQNAAAAAAAAADADSLRSQLTNTGLQVSGATCSSVRDHATTLSGLFAECVGAYQGMAKTASGHALDARTLTEAWPRP